MTVSNEEVPEFLRQYMTTQNYDLYSAIDQACWRYIMRVSREFFKKNAHEKYLTGLEATGISTERIPFISDMDEKLKKFGWRAGVITGFIPPAVFLEFLAHRILPIACDMRTLEHLEYTPSPDIVHEAAGHAPIIADHKFASYLGKFGEIARKAIFAKEDLDVYKAVLHLSEVKEDPSTPQNIIDEAYKKMYAAIELVKYDSEATQLSRLGWWSTEYGLVRQNGQYKIYGAGLLSSVGESFDSVNKNVLKLQLTIDCIHQSFDITKPQPQLYYIDDFSELENIIDELSLTMAYKIGGLKALERAHRAQTITTTVLETGLQISGVISDYVKDVNSNVLYLKYSGPCQLANHDIQIAGHGAKYHSQGFGTPLGKIKKINKTAAQMTPDDFALLEIYPNTRARIEFESGISVEGVFRSTLEENEQTLLWVWDDCTVQNSTQGEVYFKPEWGHFDMACGELIVSVFGGAADRGAYLKDTGDFSQKAKAQSSNITDNNRELVPLYEDVRKIRESQVLGAGELSRLIRISELLESKFPNDWLLRMEIIELIQNKDVASLCAEKQKLEVALRKEIARIELGSATIAGLIRRYPM
jgi:phenylalanine-4-hydroxylase